MSDYFYNAIRRDIAMIKNDTMSFGFEVRGLGGQEPDNIIFTCREDPDDEAELFSVSRIDNITEDSYDPTTDTRTYIVRIPPVLTENIERGRYFYDLQLNINYDVITLMIGRLTIDYEVTRGYSPPVDPPYDNGDNNSYPQDNIPETATKSYHELPISNIAARINDINGSSDTYTTSQMSAALTDIKEDITDISDAINAKIGGSSEIPLADIAGVITSELDKYEDGSEVEY